jgi:hypothetical protein
VGGVSVQYKASNPVLYRRSRPSQADGCKNIGKNVDENIGQKIGV